MSSAVYSEELAERFLDLLSQGLSLKDIRGREGIPCRKTIRKWRKEQPTFEARYQLARKQSAEEYEDEIICLARDLEDKDDVPVARAKFDILRWAASKRDSSYATGGTQTTREPIEVIGGLPPELIGMANS